MPASNNTMDAGGWKRCDHEYGSLTCQPCNHLKTCVDTDFGQLYGSADTTVIDVISARTKGGG